MASYDKLYRIFIGGTEVGEVYAMTTAGAVRQWRQMYPEAPASTTARLRNPGGRMTKAQRRAKARRSGAKRRKANAAKSFLKKMNPGVAKKAIGAVMRKLKGGGYSVIPILPKKANRARRVVRRRRRSH